MSDTLEVLKCGKKVTVTLGDMTGIISAVSLRFEKVSYGITYFYAGEYKEIFINREEFKVDIEDKQKVGYK